MPESAMQILYAIFATAAISVMLRTLVADHLSDRKFFAQKPFNCTYCLTVWVALPVCLFMFPVTTQAELATTALNVMVVHYCAFIVTQKLS